MEVSHLDARRGVLRVINGKGGKNREVPVAPEMFARLRVWWARHRNARFLFPGMGRGWKEKYGCKSKAQGVSRQPMSEASVQQAMTAAVLTSHRWCSQAEAYSGAHPWPSGRPTGMVHVLFQRASSAGSIKAFPSCCARPGS